MCKIRDYRSWTTKKGSLHCIVRFNTNLYINQFDIKLCINWFMSSVSLSYVLSSDFFSYSKSFGGNFAIKTTWICTITRSFNNLPTNKVLISLSFVRCAVLNFKIKFSSVQFSNKERWGEDEDFTKQEGKTLRKVVGRMF